LNENKTREEDLKRTIKEKINQLTKELEILKLCLAILNKEPIEKREKEKKPTIKKKTTKRSLIAQISDNEGNNLAKIYGEEDRVIITPENKVKVDINSREFRQFFIRKVLLGIKKERPLITYEVKDRDGILTEIVLKNITSEREIKRLQGAIKWTFKQFIQN